MLAVFIDQQPALQAFIEGRIQELEGKLAAAQIIDPSTLDVEGRIVFGATVEIEDLENGKKATYQIVGDDEADLEANKISISSPIARALIGKEEGDVVVVKTPSGTVEYEIAMQSAVRDVKKRRGLI